MKYPILRNPKGRLGHAALMLAVVASIWPWAAARGAERQFLVMLAYSPKQFPTEDGFPSLPPDGLTNKELIRKQFFDDTSPDIGSFAEYWKEISYGDVTISGDVTDWVALPWPTTPELVDGVPNTSANYLNLNGAGGFTYGAGEDFENSVAAVRVDIDGDPLGIDNGPFGLTPGNSDTSPVTGNPVWMPGERFVDMDEDGKWDGLDEARNQMDWDGDGHPDLLGPWIDLNKNGAADDSNNCLYLADDDNDGNPNCCPDGPGRTGCLVFDAAGKLLPNRCPATNWDGPDGTTWEDCNGNLIPDSCDISCTSNDCRETGWLDQAATIWNGIKATLPMGDPCKGSYLSSGGCKRFCGGSLDRLPLKEGGDPGQCLDDPDGKPDECQVGYPDSPTTVYQQGSECTTSPSPDGCLPSGGGINKCDKATFPLPQRCEYDDSNDNGELDIVEPWENFLRRWDPCLSDPDTRVVALTSGLVHWIKVYDPSSPSAGHAMVCGSSEPGSTPADYGDPSYIEDNYPGHADRIIGHSVGTPIRGEHDPLGKFPLSQCRCADLGSCRSDGTCPAGVHDQYDPPDLWRDVIATNGPGNTTVRTSKMRIAPFPETEGATAKPDWYEQAWSDRYVGGPNHPLRQDPVVGNKYRGCLNSDSTSFVTCAPPSWPGGTGAIIPSVEHFNDVDPDTYDPRVNGSRRYFQANRGGAHGDGSGWIGCDSDYDPFVVFETGQLGPSFFEEACDHPILPEEVNGASEPGIFYDGWVEHDDLPSSKYHSEGDERLGEVTSPYNDHIWGDGAVAAGPYATRIHGNFGTRAGDLLTLELLTWRTHPPFDNGFVWEEQHGLHPYAGPSAGNLGFRDYNLDGLIDQGEVRHPGSESYSRGGYPFNTQRLVEDCVEILDSVVDFDDWLDPIALDAVSCHDTVQANKPRQYLDTSSSETIEPDGLVSGIVLLPSGSQASSTDFSTAFRPIHTEDGDNPEKKFPKQDNPLDQQISWNLFFHNAVTTLDTPQTIPNDQRTTFATRLYLKTWEDFPVLYDQGEHPPYNTPIGRWDIMAGHAPVPTQLVHSIPILKEKPCTEWTVPIDLTTVLTPGVEAIVTLPPAELVRDGYYFLENPSNLGERFYFWSVGRGFDEPGFPGFGDSSLVKAGLPGTGMLVLHTDVGSNPDALPAGQETGTRFTYVIEQADGLEQLDAGEAPFGDAGDPFPGSSDNQRFNYDSNPAARWYTQNSWTGLDINGIFPDGRGSVLAFMTWVPTTIPSMSFTDPPGGSSVGTKYQIRMRATDVRGGTTIRVYYSSLRCSGNGAVCVEDANCPAGQTCTHSRTILPLDANLVGTVKKTTPGTNDLSMDWNISTIPDGRYRFFAELLPGVGADGISEKSFSTPRPGRNNVGTGTLTVNAVNIKPQATRLETWTARLIDITASTTQKWVINGTLTQPAVESDLVSPDPKRVLLVPTGGSKTYESPGGEVRFTIANVGTNFAIGDSWSFVTTGITALSADLTVADGNITEGPRAVINASPLSGPPPLKVTFDGRNSVEPNGSDLIYGWDFGDGAFGNGATATHTYTKAGTFTVTLHVTSDTTGLFNETSVDIEVSNNKPTAKIAASPTSGPAPLTVKFSGASSSDLETTSANLVYQWDFGDGATANGAGAPGTLIDTEHFYSKKANGTACTSTAPCTFVAKLTVTDDGGKQDVASVEIQVGNSNPVAKITHSALQGPAPLDVVFNALNSTDADGNTITVEWSWGDGSAKEKWPVTGAGTATDGGVPHTFEKKGQYTVSAVLTDGRGGTAKWAGVTVVVTDAVEESSTPHAIFTVTPDRQVVGQPVEVNAENSFDRPAGDAIASYTWDWGDGSPNGSGVKASHVYDQPHTYTIILTVADAESPPNTHSTSRTATIISENEGPGGPVNRAPTARFIVTGGPVNPTEGIAGETVFTFDAGSSSDPDGDDLTFDWLFGDGTPLQVDGPAVVTHRYDVAKTYLVQLTVRDVFNLATNTTQSIVIRSTSLNQAPVALITTGARSGPLPFAIQLTTELSYDPDGGPLLGYAWYVGDGTNEVRLQVDAQRRWQGTVTTPEDADANQLPVTVCLGENRGARIFWSTVECSNRPSGTEDIEIRPSSNDGATLSAVFRTEGEFTVSLEVSDGAAVGRGDPEQVIVTAQATGNGGNNGDGEDSGNPIPGGGTGSASRGLCGLGIIIGLLGSLFGLAFMKATRRHI